MSMREEFFTVDHVGLTCTIDVDALEGARTTIETDATALILEGDPLVLLSRLGGELIDGEPGTREGALSRARIALAAISSDADDSDDGTDAVDLIAHLLHYLRSIEERTGESAEIRQLGAWGHFLHEDSEWRREREGSECATCGEEIDPEDMFAETNPARCSSCQHNARRSGAAE